MRAQILTRWGGPENFKLTEVPIPSLKPGHVRVRVAAASVNPVDTKIRNGLPIGPELPAILGCDFAGIVEAVSPDVTNFEVGEAVYGCAGGVRGQGGSLAELIVADANLIARKPKILSMREAAALPLVSITAWEGFERAGLTAGQQVLIHGGVGGVGHVAVQLAKSVGARVAATVSSEESGRLAISLGADETINYSSEIVEAYVKRLAGGKGFDVVFDTVGGNNLANSFKATRANGQIATTNARATQDLSDLHAKGLSLHVVFMLLPMLTGIGRARHGKILADLAAKADAGQVRPLIDREHFTLETTPQAHRRLESGQAIGKVVIDIAALS